VTEKLACDDEEKRPVVFFRRREGKSMAVMSRGRQRGDFWFLVRGKKKKIRRKKINFLLPF